MKELYNDMDDRSRNAAQNIRIAFDESAWDKMEALLNDEDKKSVVNDKAVNKNYAKALLLLIFLVTATAIFFIKYDNNSKRKNLLLTSNDKNIINIEPLKKKQNPADKEVHEAQPAEGYTKQSTSGKNYIPNKNIRLKATADNITTFSITTDSNNKKVVSLKTYNDVFETRKEDLEQSESKEKVIIKNIQSEPGKISNDVNKTKDQLPGKGENLIIDSNRQQVKASLKYYIKDSIIVADSGKNKKSSAPLKNKFFKNIGLSVFASPEINTVRFRQSDKITAGYGAGINYNIGKHFTLQAQFAKTRKVYVTNSKGYSSAVGSFAPVNILKVNADCKVWDVPVNLRYSFAGNCKNSFFISAGISSYIMKKEIYDFIYYNQGAYTTKQRIIENENKHSFCNLNLSAGYQYWLNKKWSVGFEPYLKLPIYGIGAGKVKLTTAGALFNISFKPM